jgi:hypothetical protein
MPLTVIGTLEPLGPDERYDQVRHHDRGNDGENHVLHAGYTLSKAKIAARKAANSPMLNSTNATSSIP